MPQELRQEQCSQHRHSHDKCRNPTPSPRRVAHGPPIYAPVLLLVLAGVCAEQEALDQVRHRLALAGHLGLAVGEEEGTLPLAGAVPGRAVARGKDLQVPRRPLAWLGGLVDLLVPDA